jgi:hypothetical protein
MAEATAPAVVPHSVATKPGRTCREFLPQAWHQKTGLRHPLPTLCAWFALNPQLGHRKKKNQRL